MLVWWIIDDAIYLIKIIGLKKTTNLAIIQGSFGEGRPSILY